MLEIVHAILTGEGEYGFTLISPQLPGFIGVYADEASLMRLYKDDLRAAGVSNAQVVGHMQVRGETPSGREYLVRWCTDGDDDAQERAKAGDLALRVLHGDEGDELLDGAEPDRTGVVVIVCCLATDSLGWVASQMDQQGDALVIAANVADEMLFATTLATVGMVNWPSLAEQGLSLETTVGELMVKRELGAELEKLTV